MAPTSRPGPRVWPGSVSNWTKNHIATGLRRSEDAVTTAMDSEAIQNALARIQNWKETAGVAIVPRLSQLKPYTLVEGEEKTDLQVGPCAFSHI